MDSSSQKLTKLSSVSFIALAGFILFVIFTRFAVNYVWLIADFPLWWLGFFGESDFSALLHMHFIHLLALVSASMPIALLLGYFVRNQALRITFIYGILVSLWLIKDLYIAHDESISSLTVSNIADVVKFLFTLTLVTWLYLCISSPNRNKLK